MKNLYWVKMISCLLLAASLHAQQPIVEPTDRVVALAGTMRMVHGYGPPGYGEDPRRDVRVSYLAVQLTFKVTTVCTPQLPELQSIQCGATDVLRLVFPINIEGADLKRKARTLIGDRVLVTGVLHRQEAMADYTRIYMDVAEVSAIQSESGAKSHR
jgi:hypothetical protein